MAEPVTDDQKWAAKQRRLTDVSTGLTAVGATALGTMLAGKTKAGQKVLPKKLAKKLVSSKSDDARNTIALASMIGGVASGVHWSGKLKSDAKKPPVVLIPQEQALNLAKAMHTDIEKSIVGSGIRLGRRLPGQRVYYRGYMRKPMRRYLRGVTT